MSLWVQGASHTKASSCDAHLHKNQGTYKKITCPHKGSAGSCHCARSPGQRV